MASALKKQTNRNNLVLMSIKRTFNKKIYAEAARLMNEQGLGPCVDYIVEFYAEEFQPHKRAELLRLAQ